MPNPASFSLAAIVEAHYDELKAFVLRRVGCPAAAADVVQDVWLRSSQTAPAEPILNARAYLYRVAANLATDHLRRQRLHSRHIADDDPTAVPSAQPGPDLALASREEYAILREAIRDLPDKCRTAFLLSRDGGLTMRQIADRLGISDKTVEKHIAKALLHCRRRLREAGRHV